jgi:hypothetical protein
MTQCDSASGLLPKLGLKVTKFSNVIPGIFFQELLYYQDFNLIYVSFSYLIKKRLWLILETK